MFGKSQPAMSEVEFLREQVRTLQERCDRLTEALAHHNGINLDLNLPRPVNYEPAPTPSTGGVGAAKIDQWWASQNTGHSIATPPKPKENKSS